MAEQIPELLTPEQVADYLQMSINEVMELLVSGKMPASCLAGKWRIRKGKLDDWIDSQSVNRTGTGKNSVELTSSQSVALEPTSERNRINLDNINTVAQSTINNSTGVELETFATTQTKESLQPNPSSNTLKERPKWTPPTQTFEGKGKRLIGTVTKFKLKDGYGFIKGDDGRIFYVSSINIADWGQSLRGKERVEFEPVRVPQGWVAKNVVSLSNKSNPSLSQGSSSIQQISPETLKYYEQALVAKEEKDLDRARRLFEKAIEAGPSLNVFQAYASMEEKEANRVESALKVLERGIQVFPYFGALYNDKAMLLRKRKKLQEAVETLEEGLRSAPAFSKQLHWSLAQILIELADAGDKESLEKAYTHAEEAKKLGMPLEDDPRYKKLQLSREKNLGHQALDFFSAVGIETRVESMNNDYADILITCQHIEFIETYDLKGRILARCFFRKVQKPDLDNLLRFLREHSSICKGQRINSDIAFIILDDSSPWRDALYRIIAESREAVVPLDKYVFDQAQSEDKVALLRQLLDQWLSRRDLFKNNAPVSGRRFFGRETELQNLMRNIDDGQHTGIYGLRKVGKTSLMYQLQEKRSQDLVVYIDLQQIPSTHHDCAYLYWIISRQLQDILDQKRREGVIDKTINLKLGSKKKYSDLDKPEKRNALHFTEDIDLVINLLSCVDAGSADDMTEKRIIIAIDELEYMLPISNNHSGFLGYADFFSLLRGIAQKTKGKLVSVVAAANPMISEQATWEGRDNPVFQFYKDTFLPPLTKTECDEMLEKLGRGMNISFDPDSLDAIYSETGGHPYITRQLCSHIIGKNQSRPLKVTLDLVVNNLETFLRDKSDVFREILDRLDYFPQEKDLLYFIAEGLSQESELASLVTDPIDIALRHLIGYQIVDYEDGHYKIKINLLNRWLQRFSL